MATCTLAAYPERPITVVVPFAAGGSTDKLARDWAEVLRKGLGNQTVLVENVGGVGGTLGASKVAEWANVFRFGIKPGGQRLAPRKPFPFADKSQPPPSTHPPRSE